MDILINITHQTNFAVDSNLQHFFDLVYRGLVPVSVRRYFSDSYLFSLI